VGRDALREVAVAKLVLTRQEAALCDVIGTSAFLRARAHVNQGELVDVRWEPEFGRAHGQVRGGSGVATAAVATDAKGAIAAVDGSCTCALRPSCAHPAALVLAALPEPVLLTATSTDMATALDTTTPEGTATLRGAVPRPRTRTQPAAWEAALATLMDRAAATTDPREPEQAQIGLQLELVSAAAKPGARPGARPGTTPAWQVIMRPVVPGRDGTSWIRTGINWSTLEYSPYGLSAQGMRHRRLLQEILTLSGKHRYYGSYQQTVSLETFSSRRIWDLLVEADEIGLPIVHSRKAADPVVISRRPARMSMRVERAADDDLVLVPTLSVDGVPVAPDCAILVGQPAHGVVWWGVRGEPEPPPRDRVLRLAPLAQALASEMVDTLAGPAIRIPAQDETHFFHTYYPDLLRQVEVVAAEDCIDLPDLGPATLTLTVDRLVGHELGLHWQWVAPLGDQQRAEPLWGPPPAAHADERDSLVRQVTKLVADRVPGLLEPSPTGPRLAATATVGGDAMVRFLSEIEPELADLPGVDVLAGPHGSGLDYREAREAPVISFVGADDTGQLDWFDLSVEVSVDGEQVAFDELFVALAQDRSYLILPSGTYFSLERPEFGQLRELIAEARELEDAPAGVLRVGRFQAGLWQELAELGEITGQARAWQQSVRSLTEGGVHTQYPLPKGLEATLRPYQVDGFGWLAALYENRLGGVLADDMGLGKTLQTLALICHAHDNGESHDPFLVVAPSSVVHNWVNEAARFAPNLTVRAVTQSHARRGVELAEAVRGADIVITSYTLFRLEHDAYQAITWSGLVLDEAQFVKNPHSQGYRCAKRLAAPFKLAITGTPMENNLAELWSLCSITAPGLFSRLDRFTDYYRNPIEKERNTERLAQLRRRIRPLMLRRRKSDVVTDLPDKQEQVLELDLNPKHRRVYQTYLQRERQKVLGLLGDMEKNRFEIFRSLTLLRQASLDVALVNSKHRDVPATKLDALTEQVGDIVSEGHRTLVFSQFTRFLDSARQRLERTGIECCYLDGKTRNRSAVITDFKNGAAPVFLISLKAGGFGLNLTEADYCILLDPWWNPATETQAVDRIHRIGQTRNVMVYRLVAKDTIEEKVMALKARKAELFSSVMDDGDFSSARLTASDIRALLE
jgi:superfamily II DNA or RNA helicase